MLAKMDMFLLCHGYLSRLAGWGAARACSGGVGRRRGTPGWAVELYYGLILILLIFRSLHDDSETSVRLPCTMLSCLLAAIPLPF